MQNLSAAVNNDIQTYSDTEVTQYLTYWYQVSAYNGSRQPGYTDPAVVTTPDNPVDIVLLAKGYKNRGFKTVDLTWNGMTTNSVDIYRSRTLIQTTSNLGFYTDNLGKGGGSYTYQVCESNSSNCSNTITVVF